jgi:hypothetical protein
MPTSLGEQPAPAPFAPARVKRIGAQLVNDTAIEADVLQTILVGGNISSKSERDAIFIKILLATARFALDLQTAETGRRYPSPAEFAAWLTDRTSYQLKAP